MNPYENHPSFCEDSDGLCEVKAERDRLRAALGEMSDELSHYPEGDGIFGHLKRILRRAVLGTDGAIKGKGAKITSRLVIQRRFQGGLPWAEHAILGNDVEHAKRCLVEHREWENTHSTFPGKLRLIRETIEVIEA